MTTAAKARTLVAGAGYGKTPGETNSDGRADKAILFSEQPRSGAHGMYFDGNDLVCTGDNGLWRFTDKDGDGRADGEPQLWLKNLKHSEHAANGVVRGPDGWYYVSC